ncbi:hypothetical protein MtrunA17_Chr8g0379041 [Medicago truncatula]|uniref:Uncharacterized protein n=1 Tax=Medicago truncatula TaxID=3880 RepID=A0A396GUZ5_MEDTR|nr:hypothetical protein MtrunA17_Chr8g0379041 [Medicago truncatula]
MKYIIAYGIPSVDYYFLQKQTQHHTKVLPLSLSLSLSCKTKPERSFLLSTIVATMLPPSRGRRTAIRGRMTKPKPPLNSSLLPLQKSPIHFLDL